MEEKSIFGADRQTLLGWCAVVGLFSLSALRDTLLLLRYDTPVGIDGYYYVVQVRSFLEHGTFYYPTNTPLVLYLMTLVARLSGNAIIAVKATSVFLHTVLGLSLFVLSASITKSIWKGLLASAVSVISVIHLIWIAEFLKQLGGLAFFFLGVACLVQNPKSNVRRGLCLSFIGVSVFCHKSMVFLILVLLCLALLFHLFNKIRQTRLAVLKICVVIFFCLCLPVVAARQSGSMPKQVAETVLSSPQSPIKRTAFEEKLSLLLLAPLSLVLCLKGAPVNRPQWERYVIGVTSLFTILFTLNPFLSHEEELMTISQRLDLLSYLQISILLAGILWLLHSMATALTLSLSIAALLLLGNQTLPIGFQQGFATRGKILLNDLIRERARIPANSLIIAPHGKEFLVTYATEVPSQNSSPASDSGKNVVWLLFETPCRAGQNAILLSGSNNCSMLVSENYPLAVTAAEKNQIITVNAHLKKAPAEVIDRVLTVRN